MRIQLFIILLVALLLSTDSPPQAVANPCAGTGNNPCAAVANPCAGAGNPCAGNGKFERSYKRDNLILHQSKSYYCDNQSYEAPTVVFRSELGNIPVFQLKIETSPDWYERNREYYTPLSRCNEIASRASEFHEMNLVSHLRIEEINNTQALCISNLDWRHLDLIAEDENAARLVFTFIKRVEPSEAENILVKVKGRTRLTEPAPIQI